MYTHIRVDTPNTRDFHMLSEENVVVHVHISIFLREFRNYCALSLASTPSSNKQRSSIIVVVIVVPIYRCLLRCRHRIIFIINTNRLACILLYFIVLYSYIISYIDTLFFETRPNNDAEEQALLFYTRLNSEAETIIDALNTISNALRESQKHKTVGYFCATRMAPYTFSFGEIRQNPFTYLLK